MDAASLIYALDPRRRRFRVLSMAARQSSGAASELILPKRKVPLQRIKNSSFDDFYNEHLNEFIEKPTREPLMKSLDVLNQKCQPVPQMTVDKIKYDYDPKRLEALDKLRQDVIHRVTINQQFPAIEADLDSWNTPTVLSSGS